MARITIALLLSLLLLTPTLSARGDLKSAESQIKKGIRDNDWSILSAGLKTVAEKNSPKATKLLLKYASLMQRGANPDATQFYWGFLNTVAKMTDAAALDEAAKFIIKNKSKAFSRDLMTALTNHGNPSLVPVMGSVLEKGADDLKILAADHLISIGNKIAVPYLIAALKKSKSGTTLRVKVGHALAVITGKDYGESITNWEGWWDANKEKDWKPAEAGTTGTLDRGRTSEWERLKKTGKVLVIEAGTECCKKSHDMDNIDRAALQLGLKVDRLNKKKLETDNRKLDEYTAILANCTFIRKHCDKIKCPDCKVSTTRAKDRMFQCDCPKNHHPQAEYTMGPLAKKKIQNYVAKGGYLFAEDWCLEDFLAEIFSQYVGVGPIRPEDETVEILPKPGMSSHPYMRKIFSRPPSQHAGGTMTESDFEKIKHNWKIDRDTRCVKLVNPQKVAVLMTSPDLAKSAEGHDAVAITFAFGGKDGQKPAVSSGGEIKQDRSEMSGGRVLYALSHFGKQASASDEYALQNLLLNFLIEANERRGRYEVKK